MKSLNPYLNFAGNTREAMNFYKDVFKGELLSMQSYAEANMQVDDKFKNNIIHAELKAEDVHFMAADGMPGFVATPGNMVSLSLDLSDASEQERLFSALSAGGTVTMPLETTFWGARFGMLTDRFGISWMLNCQLKQQ